MKRTPEGNAARAAGNRRKLDALVAQMYRDYCDNGLTLAEVGAKYGGRSMHSVFALFKKRGLPRRTKLGPEVFKRIAATRRAQLDPLVRQMHADYMRPMSLSAVARKYGRSRKDLRGLFVARGLEVRAVQKLPARDARGCILAYVPLTPGEIDALIRSATALRVPEALKFEWRRWSLERRGDFIARLRAHLQIETERPRLPFSANVEPFDYASPRAHAIVAATNAGTDSRSARIKLDICSQGVIYRGRLWFWSHKVGYQSGPWTRLHGRPALHRTIWEEHHGRTVPAAHVLRFADGNPNNLVPENLVLMTRNELARENQAAHLLKKSRAITTLLLNRSQQSSDNHDTKTLTVLSRGNR